MRRISGELRRLVIERAEKRCEYCELAQLGQEATFHIDHVKPRSEGGRTVAMNLALACVSCSLRKGARTTGIDPQMGRIVPIYNPRRHRWTDHFRWEGAHLLGRTPIGRATVKLLQMNRPLILAIRLEQEWLRRHPGP